MTKPAGEMADADLKCTLGISLLQKLCRPEVGNFVISPLSLGTAFAMLTAGLKGETKTELLRIFGTMDEEKLHAMYSDLLCKKDLPLKIANKYLSDQECEVHQQFESLLKTKYESEVEGVNFAKNARKIEADVNAWVAEKTNNMIPNLLPEETLNEDTILVLLNAIYFKGSWVEEFDPVRGLKQFRLRNGEKIRCKFIEKCSSSLRYAETDKLRLVRIPYQEEGFYMLVAIPRNRNEHIDEVIAGMQPSELVEAIRSPQSRNEVFLTMPKFKIEYNFDKVQTSLEELGVRKIFIPNVGDFGNLFSKVKRGPCVDTIIHKAVIEVDEKGTTAAAATAIVCVTYCAPVEPKIVKLDRPFCFFIMSANDMICFAGICAQP